MLKMKDNTTKQKLSVQNCGFWDEGKIRYILFNLKSIRNGVIYINDITVDTYNKMQNYFYPKSNASFVRQVRKMNKENKFDNLVEKIS